MLSIIHQHIQFTREKYKRLNYQDTNIDIGFTKGTPS